MNEYPVTVIIGHQPEGEYLVFVPALPACHTEGHTPEKARTVAADANGAYCVSLLRRGEPVPAESANPLPTSASSKMAWFTSPR